MKRFSWETKDDWIGPEYRKFRATDEEIRENQRKNRLQRERDERAAQNNNSTSDKAQDTQDKGKS